CAGGKILKLGQGEKSLADFLLAALRAKAMAQEINRRRLVADKNLLGLPLAPGLRDGPIGIRLLAQIEADKIMRRFFVELFLLLFGDHVVGRRDHLGEVANLFWIVENSAKRRDA